MGKVIASWVMVRINVKWVMGKILLNGSLLSGSWVKPLLGQIEKYVIFV